MQIITSPENAQIKHYRKLAASKKERKLTGLFVLEGLRLVLDAVKNGAKIHQLFCTEDGFSKWEQQRPPCAVPCTLLSEKLATMLSQTEHSQGVYAICKKPKSLSINAFFKKKGLYAILYQIQDPGNAGMILRTADAMGIDGVVYYACCDIYNPKVVRATMGSLFRIPVCQVNEIESVFDACHRENITTCAAVINPTAEPIGQCSFTQGTAILIGNEGNGLPPKTAQRCDRQITIPMHGNIESLNAAMAAGIILWELKNGVTSHGESN
ncbi:MAG: RNA methyltransferase [Ruminococcus sp.]|nr:RNA methyltransferase [Ruminococcus sp.]